VAHGPSLRCLQAALEAEEEALVADIAYLQGRVLETASEARQELDTSVLRARKAELQRRWLEVEQASSAAAGAEGAGRPLPQPEATAAAPSSSRLHRALRAPSGRVASEAGGVAGAAVAAAAVASAEAGAAGGGGKAGRAGAGAGAKALSRGASAALAARAAGGVPSPAKAAVEDDSYFL